MAARGAPRARAARPSAAIVAPISGGGVAGPRAPVARLAVREIPVGRRLLAGRGHPLVQRPRRVPIAHQLGRVAFRVRGVQTRSGAAPSARGRPIPRTPAKVAPGALTDTRPRCSGRAARLHPSTPSCVLMTVGGHARGGREDQIGAIRVMDRATAPAMVAGSKHARTRDPISDTLNGFRYLGFY